MKWIKDNHKISNRWYEKKKKKAHCDRYFYKDCVCVLESSSTGRNNYSESRNHWPVHKKRSARDRLQTMTHAQTCATCIKEHTNDFSTYWSSVKLMKKITISYWSAYLKWVEIFTSTVTLSTQNYTDSTKSKYWGLI